MIKRLPGCRQALLNISYRLYTWLAMQGKISYSNNQITNRIDRRDMQAIEKLKTTDDLGEHGGGIWKKWPWKDSDHYELMSDLILKAKYSIQDFNSTIGGGFLPNPKDTVYLVALATWIKDAFWQIKGNCLRKEIENDFEFSKQSELDDACKYLQVVRSIVIAHPLNSTRHQDYGFGSEGRICIDIRGKSLLDSFPKAVIHHTKRIFKNQLRGR